MPSTKPSTKRRYATMACVSCRESKTKVVSDDPVFSVEKEKRECRYQAIDKRKLPLRVAIELLTSRVDQLCHFICENGLQPPRLPHEKETELNKILHSLGLIDIRSNPIPIQQTNHNQEGSSGVSRDPVPCLPTVLPTTIATPTPEVKGSGAELFIESWDGAEPEADTSTTSEPSSIPLGWNPQHTEDSPSSVLSSWDLDLGFGTCITPALPDLQNLLGPLPNGSTSATQEEMPALPGPTSSDDDSTLVEETSSTTDIESLIDEISDRVGSLQISPGGKTHFYGPTSTFNLIDPENLQARPVSKSYSWRDDDHIGMDTEFPPELEEHLINLYFCWQDPSFHVVDKGIYEEAKAKRQNMEDTSFYSEALRHAMCALGSAFETRFHQDFVTFPKTLVDFFGDRAKAFLELELDCPCVATVQAMVILSCHEIGNGSDARGWLYSGMAIRLAFDLALHLDMSAYASKGDITPADADLRRTVFWAAYVVDHQLGFHLGRPFRTSMEDVTVGKPHDQGNKLGPSRWIPYGLQDTTTGVSGFLDCTEAVSRQLISLCELMAPCGYILYGTSSISKAVLQELNAKIVAELRRWKAKLPPFLQIDLDDCTSPYLPHVLLLQ
ncbi:transcriptional regulator family: Fungal Specific TF [Paecilomyces variotii]|nr:transcriptional regulator family: Fungal Specific TF [Paecilomyces variotii]